jgi:hypothetical protein
METEALNDEAVQIFCRAGIKVVGEILAGRTLTVAAVR